jgi:hypothetical protein
MTATLKELESVARSVIEVVKQIPEARSAKLAVIGGLALWHYLPEGRPTDVRALSSLVPCGT